MRHPLGPLAAAFRVSSPYGAPRSTGPHRGVDIACPIGTPLWATGRIVRLDRDPAKPNGLAVWWEYDGIRAVFLHMSAIHVEIGQDVDGVVGLSGSTGDSHGPHVHIGCWTQGEESEDRDLLDPGVVWGEPSWTIVGL